MRSMSPDPNREPYTGFRNPLLYTSFLLAIAALYVGWVFFSRRQDRREVGEKAGAKKREEDRRAVEMIGGNRFEILTFYASPRAIHRAETAHVCHGASHAHTVRL